MQHTGTIIATAGVAIKLRMGSCRYWNIVYTIKVKKSANTMDDRKVLIVT